MPVVLAHESLTDTSYIEDVDNNDRQFTLKQRQARPSPYYDGLQNNVSLRAMKTTIGHRRLAFWLAGLHKPK